MHQDSQSETIFVEVAYALPDRQKIMRLDVPVGTTAYQAVIDSGVTDVFEGIDPDNDAMGVFGKAIKPKAYQLQAGDRVEIYRPLQVDPKASRKARAAKAAQK